MRGASFTRNFTRNVAIGLAEIENRDVGRGILSNSDGVGRFGDFARADAGFGREIGAADIRVGIFKGRSAIFRGRLSLKNFARVDKITGV